ncbi:Uncharacterised protein [Vibrio cholerae]|nr:Uncharacterised protein [Vibrio cholerae]
MVCAVCGEPFARSIGADDFVTAFNHSARVHLVALTQSLAAPYPQWLACADFNPSVDWYISPDSVLQW